jgi:hypothetical protein
VLPGIELMLALKIASKYIVSMSQPQRPNIDAFETRLIELLYDLDAKEEVKGFFVDTYEDTTEASTVARIDALAEALGISATRWTEVYVGGTSKNEYRVRPIDRLRVRHLGLHGTTLGQYLIDQAFEILPIGTQEEGEGEIQLSLWVGDDQVLTLHSESSFDTTRPEHEDSAEESELCFDVTFRADVYNIAP